MQACFEYKVQRYRGWIDSYKLQQDYRQIKKDIQQLIKYVNEIEQMLKDMLIKYEF